MQDPALLGSTESTGWNWEVAAQGWYASLGDWIYWQSYFPCSHLEFYPRRRMRRCQGVAGSQVRNSNKQTSLFDFKMPKRCVHRHHSLVLYHWRTVLQTYTPTQVKQSLHEINKLLTETSDVTNTPVKLSSLFRYKFETLFSCSHLSKTVHLCAKVKNEIVTSAMLWRQLESLCSFPDNIATNNSLFPRIRFFMLL